jgi:hypothetical protein
MKKISKNLLSLAIISFLVLPIFAFNNAQAQSEIDLGIEKVETTLGGALGENGTDPRTVIMNIIEIALGFLGIIAVVIVLLGGFKWMTAAGNEDKVEEAKKILGAGVIGLVIVLSAWALTTFVINTIYNETRTT